jgi:hypothetical protein
MNAELFSFYLFSLCLFLVFLNWFLLPCFHRTIFACRSLIHLLYFRVINTCLSNVELNSTSLFILPDQLSSSNRQIILCCFMLVFPVLPPYSCCCGTLKDFGFYGKLYQNVGIHNDNFDCKVLKWVRNSIMSYDVSTLFWLN